MDAPDFTIRVIVSLILVPAMWQPYMPPSLIIEALIVNVWFSSVNAYLSFAGNSNPSNVHVNAVSLGYVKHCRFTDWPSNVITLCVAAYTSCPDCTTLLDVTMYHNTTHVIITEEPL